MDNTIQNQNKSDHSTIAHELPPSSEKNVNVKAKILDSNIVDQTSVPILDQRKSAPKQQQQPPPSAPSAPAPVLMQKQEQPLQISSIQSQQYQQPKTSTQPQPVPTTQTIQSPPLNETKIDMSNIKQQAISITNNIVERAKNELNKNKLNKNRISVEISDEDMVEKYDIEMIKEKLKPTAVDNLDNLQMAPSTSGISSSSRIETVPSFGAKNVRNLKISPSKETMISSSESSQQISDYRTPPSSRPQSSEFDMTIIQETTGSGSRVSSEYVTCPTATRDSTSFYSVPTSQESSTQFFTPQSSLSGKASSLSIETTSSTNLGDLSETSETIIGDDSARSDDEVNYFDEHYMKINKIDTANVEPFNSDIPTSFLKKNDWQTALLIDNNNKSTANDDNQMLASNLYNIPAGMESIDKNLYTHVEVEEENDDSSLDEKIRKLIHHADTPKRLLQRHQLTETETSSTSSSLKEFERLECEVVKDKDDFSVDSKHSLEWNKLEKTCPDNINLYSYDPEDFNESLNSELSQDTVTCIVRDENKMPQLSQDVMNTSQTSQSKQLSESLISFQQETGDNDDCLHSAASIHQPMLCSLDSNINPVLDCDFTSLNSSMIASVDNGLKLCCDEQIHPALIASMTDNDDDNDDKEENGGGGGCVNSGTRAGYVYKYFPKYL